MLLCNFVAAVTAVTVLIFFKRKIRPHLDLLSIPRLWGKKCQNVLSISSLRLMIVFAPFILACIISDTLLGLTLSVVLKKM